MRGFRANYGKFEAVNTEIIEISCDSVAVQKAWVESMGGDAAFIAALDSLFDIESTTTGREQADITGRIGQYAHGNEPSHHVAWLYHFAGRPDKSAARVDRIRRDFYTPRPDGLIGNEDCGQMSSWYVFAALGLYPVSPGSDQYVIVPPLFAEASVEMDSGDTFRVRRRGAGLVEDSHEDLVAPMADIAAEEHDKKEEADRARPATSDKS